MVEEERREAEPNDGRKRRSIKNILIDPLLQVKLGLYSILLSFVFAASVTFILYTNLSKFAVVVMTMTDVEEEMRQLFIQYMGEARWWLILAVLIFLVLNVLVSVIYTHRLVGPTVAFNRHLANMLEGKYSSRVNLRQGDAFMETAEKLNALAEKLGKSDT